MFLFSFLCASCFIGDIFSDHLPWSIFLFYNAHSYTVEIYVVNYWRDLSKGRCVYTFSNFVYSYNANSVYEGPGSLITNIWINTPNILESIRIGPRQDHLRLKVVEHPLFQPCHLPFFCNVFMMPSYTEFIKN